MKSAILVKNKKPLGFAISFSKLNFGQVLVKVFYSGICGAQINEIDAVKGPDKFLPHLLGHEGSGVVERVGKGVTTVKEGDRVVLHWNLAQAFNQRQLSTCGMVKKSMQVGLPHLMKKQLFQKIGLQLFLKILTYGQQLSLDVQLLLALVLLIMMQT